MYRNMFINILIKLAYCLFLALSLDRDETLLTPACSHTHKALQCNQSKRKPCRLSSKFFFFVLYLGHAADSHVFTGGGEKKTGEHGTKSISLS